MPVINFDTGQAVLLVDAGRDSGTALVETVPVLFPFAAEFADTKWDFFATGSLNPAVQAQTSITSYRLPDGTI